MTAPDQKGYVPGEGPIPARLMLIGQNPGREELKIGKPFVGRSGKYLDSILSRNGIDRGKIYITSVVKQGTPHNRYPKKDEIRYWMPRIVEEIGEVKPEIVVLMGTLAWTVPRLPGIQYIQTYHPSAAMRFPAIRLKFEKDISELSRRGPFN